jgi:opacity protein-like surface antigen
MKKSLLLVAALVVTSLASAQATDAAGKPTFKFLLGAGLTGGGEKLATVVFTDGTTDRVQAGGLILFYGGGEIRLGDNVALQATLGYHSSNTRAASNGSVSFTRVPVDLLAMFSVNDNIRLGGGLQVVTNPRLKSSGAASGIEQKYDGTTGLIVEGEYLFTPHLGLKGRYVSEKYKASGTGVKVDGSYLGVLFTYYF